VSTIRVRVNGVDRSLAATASLADAVATVVAVPQGVAAALNGEVVPRRSWPGTAVAEGDGVEVVTAVQGG
jgi:sulfur carrier protein